MTATKDATQSRVTQSVTPRAFAAHPAESATPRPPATRRRSARGSGLASQHGVTLVNSPGTIDADYRGEVQVPLINLGQAPFVVERGMRIAQMVVLPVPPVQIVEVDELDETDRGTGGFGHTGH